MNEIIRWAFSMVPGLAIITAATFIIFGFIVSLITWKVSRRYNIKQWPIEHQKNDIEQKTEILNLKKDLKIITHAYNERYCVDRQIKQMINAIDNRILKRGNT